MNSTLKKKKKAMEKKKGQLKKMQLPSVQDYWLYMSTKEFET